MTRRAVVAFVAAVVVLLAGQAAMSASEIEADCVEMSGAYDADAGTCTVTTVTQEEFADPVRPSGNSGRGWTAEGVETTTTVDVYETVTSTEEVTTTEVIEGQKPDSQSCSTPNPPVVLCGGVQETTEVVTTVSWDDDPASSDDTVDREVETCVNPGGKALPGVGRNKALHQHCG